MVAPHFGHSLVLAEIQLLVSLSSSHFLIHFLMRWHLTGSCQFSLQAKQKEWPQAHLTGLGSTCCTFTALLQSGLGHQRSSRLHCTKLLVMRCWYFSLTLGGIEGFRKRLKERKNQPWIGDQRHHRLVVDDYLAAAGALDHLACTLVHDLGGKVLRPARSAI